jgi:hypothetical protein
MAHTIEVRTLRSTGVIASEAKQPRPAARSKGIATALGLAMTACVSNRFCEVQQEPIQNVVIMIQIRALRM